MLRFAPYALLACFAASPSAQPADLGWASPAPLEADASSLPLAQDGDDPAWTWSGNPQWLDGVSFGYSSFGGGLDYGSRYFLGSSLDDTEFVPVEIVFDKAVVTNARVFRRDRSYADGGVGTFWGAAYDVSDPEAPRRLNVGFVEDGRTGRADQRWQPDGSESGGREYLLVFASSYDGDGATYAGQTAAGLDLLYGLSARIRTGESAYASSPATLALSASSLRDVEATAVGDGSVTVRWTLGDAAGVTMRLSGDAGRGETALADVDARDGAYTLTDLDPDAPYTIRARLLDGDGSELASEARSVRPALSSGVLAVSRLDPGRSGGRSYGDVWGYTAPDGTEYALLAGRGTGLSIIDITGAPEDSPVEVAFVPIEPGASDAKDVKVYASYAYLVNEVGPIQVIDLTDPANPVQVGTLDTQPGVRDGGAHNVAVFDGHLWVTGGRQSGNAGVRVYDVRTTPASPAYVGGFRPDHHRSPYYHDFEVYGDYGFGPNIYGGGVDILDVSDPSNISLVSTWAYPDSGAHNTCATEDGQTLYVGDEIGAGGNWTRIVDISDPDDPEFVGEVIVDRQAAVHNCYVRGDLLFIAHYTEGTRIYDVAEPLAPVEVGFHDVYTRQGYGYNGSWTVYPYFQSGKLIVSDMQAGLFVIETDPAVVRLNPVASPARPEAPVAGLTVGPNPARNAATVAYELAGPGRVRLTVVDARGRELTAHVEASAGGRHRVRLDTSDWATGVYLVRLAVAGDAPVSRTLTVVR